MTPPRGAVLQSTHNLMVLKTLDAMGPLHGYGMTQRIQQVFEDLLKLNQGTLYPALLRAGAARLDQFEMGLVGQPPQGQVLLADALTPPAA
jgi:PadR family transcriptional regulator, regulatory protein PadR